MAERSFKDMHTDARHIKQPDKSSKTAENPISELLQLQRQLGNQAVQRLMKSGRLQLSGSNVLQAKLTVTAAGDQYEQEADKVAAQVVNGGAENVQREESLEDEGEGGLQMKRDAVQREESLEDEGEGGLQMKRDFVQRDDDDDGDDGGGLQMKRDFVQREESLEDEGEGGLQMKRDTVQREESLEDEGEGGLQMKRDTVQREESLEDEGEGGLQMKRDTVQREESLEDESEGGIQTKRDNPADGFEVGGDVEQTIQAQRGSGQALPEQGFFEKGFGQDFSGVRVHADKQADSLNQSLSARAFTVGSDIFFRSGELNPSGQAGKELIAHELTHVVQQGGSKVQKKDDEK